MHDISWPSSTTRQCSRHMSHRYFFRNRLLSLFIALFAMPTLNAILLKWVNWFGALLKLETLSQTSLRFELRTVNDDLPETHRIYIQSTESWDFSERKQKKAKMWVREPSIGWLVAAFECTPRYFLSLDSKQKNGDFMGNIRRFIKQQALWSNYVQSFCSPK